MASPDPAPLLNLDTLTEHPSVLIDKHAYALTPPEALSAVDYHRIGKIAPRMFALWESETALTPEQEVELEETLDRVCRIILKAPDEVHDRLTDLQRLSIYQTFLTLPQETLLPLVGQPTTTRRRTPLGTGGRLLPGSPASMAAPPGTGSRRSRSRSSSRVLP